MHRLNTFMRVVVDRHMSIAVCFACN